MLHGNELRRRIQSLSIKEIVTALPESDTLAKPSSSSYSGDRLVLKR
jgi:hypothetical protein